MKNHNRKPRGFTLTELMVTITIIVTLAAVVFALSRKAMDRAKFSGSISRAKDLGVLVLAYSGDRNGELPVWHDYNKGKYWWQLVAEESGIEGREAALFKSPNHDEFDEEAVASTISYGWNYPVIGRHKGDSSFRGDHVLRVSQFRNPSKVLVFSDGARTNSWGFIDQGANVPDPDRYQGKAAGFLLDGSVRVLQTPDEFGEDSEWYLPIKQLVKR